MRVDLGDHRISVLFYDDGRLKLKIYETTMVITEAYLRGEKNPFTAVSLKPG